VYSSEGSPARGGRNSGEEKGESSIASYGKEGTRWISFSKGWNLMGLISWGGLGGATSETQKEKRRKKNADKERSVVGGFGGQI